MIRAAGAILLVASSTTIANAAPRAPIPAPPPSPPDDSAVDQAADANFDDDAPRHGFEIAAAGGPAQQVGFKIPESTGTGAGISIRLGARATRRLSLLFELDGTNYKASTGVLNASLLAGFGAKLRVRDALWLRAAIGGAGFSRGYTGDSTKVYSGLGGVFGAGVDVLRRDHFALSAELTLIGAKYKGGSVAGGFLALGVAYD